MSVVIHLDLNSSRPVILCAKRTGIFQTVCTCVCVYVLYMYMCIPPEEGGGVKLTIHLPQSAKVKNE